MFGNSCARVRNRTFIGRCVIVGLLCQLALQRRFDRRHSICFIADLLALLLDEAHTGQRTLDTADAIFHDVGVDHGGADVLVSEQLLYGTDVVAGLKEVRRKRVSHGVRMDGFDDA